MKAVIMAAGKGIRFGDLTKNTPKPLLPVGGKPILWHILEALPSEIDEAFVVVGYLGDKIKTFFGSHFGALKIQYVEQGEMGGTAGAIWSAQPFLGQKSFLVISGDDFYGADDLKALLKYNLAIALSVSLPGDRNFYGIELNTNDNLRSFKNGPISQELPVATGAYMLDQRIFRYEPVKIKNGEYGLPQTILKLAMDYPVKGVMMKNWLPGNTAEDLRKAKICKIK